MKTTYRYAFYVSVVIGAGSTILVFINIMSHDWMLTLVGIVLSIAGIVLTNTFYEAKK